MVLIRTPTDLGALIRERRRKLGLDQRELARRAGAGRWWRSNGANRALKSDWHSTL